VRNNYTKRMLFGIIIFLFIGLFQIKGQDNCRQYRTCLVCFEDPSCGWCSDDNLCVVGNSTGPSDGTCTWNYYNCPSPSPSSTTTSTSTTSTTTTSTTSSPPSAEWVTVGTNLVISSDGSIVTRTATQNTWTSAWIPIECSEGFLNATIQVVAFYSSANNVFDLVMGLVSVSCAESYTGNQVDELIGYTGSNGGCGGWSYIAGTGEIEDNGNVAMYGPTWMNTGDMITMQAQLKSTGSGSIYFFKNGVSLGQAFNDVSSNNYYFGVSIYSTNSAVKIISASCTN